MNPVNKYYDTLKPIIRSLPEKPGVYQYFNSDNKILYVGKAKNLKKRVSSYFNKDLSKSGKVAILVKKIAYIKYIVVDTELDALLLENNLIKKYQPHYNVMLKDDKTFPWICIKNEAFPRVFQTRHVLKDGSDYFGPYASTHMMRTLLNMVRQLYPLRNCKLNLTQKNIEKRKFKVCLEYHIGNCLGPCEGFQKEEDYNNTIFEIKNIIKGNINSVIRQLRELMKKYAGNLEFENAHLIKEKIDTLENYKSKSIIVNPAIKDVDVFSIISDKKTAFVNYLKVIHGAIIQAHTIEIKKKLDESNEELLEFAITDFRQRFSSESKEVIIPFKINIQNPNIKYTIPKRGDKKKLLELSERNVKFYKLAQQKRKDLVDPERHSNRILNTMMKDLRLKKPPKHIECFDNSNIQGEFPVAAMVVFKNAKPSKKEYRHYNIKTVEGVDDFASMKEIVYRRYKRLLDEKKSLPELIIIDGGKGQLSAAVESLEKLELRGKISIIGIAKKLEEIYYPGDTIPIYLNKKSETLKIIQQARDEAHRFGITHYRKKHGKEMTKTILTEINGIGSMTIQQLLTEFKSVKKIKITSLEDLQKNIGKAKGKIVFDYFNK